VQHIIFKIRKTLVIIQKIHDIINRMIFIKSPLFILLIILIFLRFLMMLINVTDMSLLLIINHFVFTFFVFRSLFFFLFFKDIAFAYLLRRRNGF